MGLDELSKAILLVLHYKAGWRSPVSVAPIISMLEDEFKQRAGRLVREGLLESRVIRKRKPGRWEQWIKRTQYKLSEQGKEAIKELLEVIDQTQSRGKL